MNQHENIFINSGMRDQASAAILQSKNIQTLGAAIGYLLSEEFECSCAILIAIDTRPSGNRIKNDLIAGLQKFGHDIFDAGIAPTPFVAKALKDYEAEDEDNGENAEDSFFTLGIVITASHNPAEYNGIKILTPFGYLDIDTELEISNIFHQFLQNPKLIEESLPDETGSVIDFDLKSWYQSEILDVIEKIPKKISIVLDCVNGATAQIAPQIFQACGYRVTAINNTLDGDKINSSTLQNLIQAIQKHDLDWGVAFDGDGDRMIMVNRQGTIFDGDDILSILSKSQNYQDQKTLVGTIMTNTAIQNYLTQQNKKLIRTPVGERNLIEALVQQQAYLGAETCGHIIMMDHAFCSDGIFSALMFLQTVAEQPGLTKKSYQKYAQKHATIALASPVNQTQLKQLSSEYEKKNACRIIVRPSNTEPVLRIMVEHKDEQTAEKILQDLKNELIKILKI
ncbi:hypothetical protein A3J41_02805 [candidate division TM6 bacterium RIFCSPHIGHO2_12_FULL_38_8]|nr:MAG: hypothetical protein A3J41_02805 [candidate division TM6 bacterium RIFCSPHIGHO2_12_FULL_38_8]